MSNKGSCGCCGGKVSGSSDSEKQASTEMTCSHCGQAVSSSDYMSCGGCGEPLCPECSEANCPL
jgi:hypothetical protein